MSDLPRPASFSHKIVGLLRQRCPRCLDGRIYGPGKVMNARCPVCGLRFEREPGYFLGALYISYGLATVIMLAGLGVLYLFLPDWDLGVLMLGVIALFIPLAPTVLRYSRVSWIYFDRWAWPTRPGTDD